MIIGKLKNLPKVKLSLQYNQTEYDFYSEMLEKTEDADLRKKFIDAQDKIFHEMEQEASDYKILTAAIDALPDVQKQIIISKYLKNTIKPGSHKLNAMDFYKSIGLTKDMASTQRKAALKALEAAYLSASMKLATQSS